MADPAYSDLTANGLFRCEKDDEVYCSICPTDARLESWEQHLEDRKHSVSLEQFHLIFDTSNGRVFCRLCDKSVDRPSLKSHARTHMRVPWNRPEEEYDKYEIFFENRIFEWNTLFCCCICDATFLNCDVAIVHITDPVHQSRKDETPLQIYKFPSNSASYEFIVSEGLIASDETSLECRICAGCKVCLESVEKHAKGLMHKSNKSKFKLVIEPWDELETEELLVEETYKNSQSDESPTKKVEVASNDLKTKNLVTDCEQSTAIEVEVRDRTKNKKTVGETLPCNYIVRQRGEDCYCFLCNCSLPEHSIKNHVADKEHVDAMRAYGCDKISLNHGSEYFCQVCHRVIGGVSRLYHHVVGNKHVKALVTFAEECARRRRIEAEAAKHPEGTRQKSLNDNITRLEDDFYHCRCCNLILRGTIELYIHVKQKKHRRLNKLSSEMRVVNNVERDDEAKPIANNVATFDEEKQKAKNVETFDEEKQIANNAERVEDEKPVANNPETFNEEIRALNNLGSVDDENRVANNLEGVDEEKTYDENSETSYQATPYNFYLVKLKDSVLRCTVCDCLVTSSKFDVNIHVRQRYHVDSLKRYGCDEIWPNEDNGYHCRCCDNRIASLRELHLHIKDESHLRMLNSSEKRQVDVNKDAVKPLRRPHATLRMVEESRWRSSITIGKQQIATATSSIDSQKKDELPSNSPKTLSEQQPQKTPRPLDVQQRLTRRAHDSSTPDVDSQKKDTLGLNLPKKSSEQEPQRTPRLLNVQQRLAMPVHDSSIPYVNLQKKDELRLNLPKILNELQLQMRPSSSGVQQKSRRPVRSTSFPDVDSQRKDELRFNSQKTLNDMQLQCYRALNVQQRLGRPIRRSSFPDDNTHARDEPRTVASKKLDAYQLPRRTSAPDLSQRLETIPERVHESTSCNYLVRLNATNFRCNVCDCIVAATSLGLYVHVRGNFHAESLKNHGCDYIEMRGGNMYHCECCAIEISNVESVYRHIKSVEHIDKVARSRSNGPRSKRVAFLRALEHISDEAFDDLFNTHFPATDKTEATVRRAPASAYILNQDNAFSYCRICDVKLSAGPEIEHHIAGMGHATAMQRYGCDLILLEGGDKYYCEGCKCKILGCENVCNHARGRRHALSRQNIADAISAQKAKCELD